MIGIIGAMQVEIDELVPLISNLETKKINNRTFYVGKIEKMDVVVVECGVGKVNASITTTMLLENFKIDFIINTFASIVVRIISTVVWFILFTFIKR